MGTGAQGEVLKVFRLGIEVEIKRSLVMDEGNNTCSDFHREITPSIIVLLSCSFAGRIPILVYEFMDRGELYALIHDSGITSSSKLLKPYTPALPKHVAL